MEAEIQKSKNSNSRVPVYCDLALLLYFCMLPMLWLFGRFTISWSSLQITIPWGKKAVLIFMLLVIFRIILAVIYHRSGRPAVGLWRTKPFPNVVMALFSLYIFFGGLELFLKLRGFEANMPPVIFEGKDEQGGRVVPETLPDPELLWKFQPGSEFHGRKINQLGFREREVNPQKAPDTRRIICMGDSITGQGRPGYAEYLHQRLQSQPPGPGGWEAFNVGVHGYCVLQGLVLFDRLDPVLDPDIVTIYFGWNDHWLDATPMSQQMAVRLGSVSGRMYEVFKRSRLFCFMIMAMNPTKPLAKNNTSQWVYRVPPEQYREGLTTLIRKIKASQAIPVVITAPRRNLTDALVKKNYARSISEAETIHDEYVDITRDVARKEQVPLFDLVTLLEGPENDPLFAPDGIHFDHYMREGYLKADPASQPGLERIGQELHVFISNMVANARQ